MRCVEGTNIHRESEAPMSLLQVPMIAGDPKVSLQNLCDHPFATSEINDPANAWEVYYTHYECYQERLRILEPPRHILMHLKRFAIVMDNGIPVSRKIDTPIEFSPDQSVDVSKAFDGPVTAQYRVNRSPKHEGNLIKAKQIVCEASRGLVLGE